MTIPSKTSPPPRGDLLQRGRGSTDYAAAHGCTEDFSLDELADVDHRGVCRGTFTQEPPATVKSAGWAKFLFWEGGTLWDAFFTCASAQVGQVILSLPHSLRQTGLLAGVALLLLFASLAMWTVYLMVVLYLEHKNRAIARGTWYNAHRRRSVAVQYHEVMGSLSHTAVGTFSRVIVIIALGGLAVAQIIASSSNFHSLVPTVSKRDWALVFGGVALCMSLLPTFRNFRAFSFLALVATTFTAWFMVTAGVHGSGGQGLQAVAFNNQTPSQGWHGFMAGASNIIFVFGGHAMLFEVMDAMFVPYKFHRVFYFSYLYVYTLILPNSVFLVAGWFDEAAKYGNVYAYLPRTVARDLSVVLMVLHQVIVFALFAFPLYFMAEKALKVHSGPLWKRYAARLPVGLLLWLIALAIPFFGVINDVLGAFTTTFETFIIPPLVYNVLYFHSADAAANRATAPKPPGHLLRWLGGWTAIKWFNWGLIIFIAVFGFGMGGYASIRALVDAASSFGLFAKCYNC